MRLTHYVVETEGSIVKSSSAREATPVAIVLSVTWTHEHGDRAGARGRYSHDW